MKFRKGLLRIIFLTILILPVLYVNLASELNKKIDKVRDEISIRVQSIRDMENLIAGMPTIEHSINFQSFGQVDASVSSLVTGDSPVREFFILDDDLSVLHSVFADYNDVTDTKGGILKKWDSSSQYLFWGADLFIFKKATKGYVAFRLNLEKYFNDKIEREGGMGVMYKNLPFATNSNKLDIQYIKADGAAMRYFFSFLDDNGVLFVLIVVVATLVVEVTFRLLINPFRRLVFFLQNLSNAEIRDESIQNFPRLFRPYIKSILDANEQIRSANQRERELEIEKGQYRLAQQVAHDIRSPLGVLKSLKNELNPKKEEDRRIFQNCMNRIEEIALNLVKTSNDSSRDTEKKSEDLLTVLESVLTEKRAEYRTHESVEIQGEFTTTSYGLHSEIRSSFLKRIVSNLINNSVEACSKNNCLIRVRLYSQEGMNYIEVADNGPGIAPEFLEHIFTKGFTTKPSGNGLGLSGAKEEIETMGGQIKLISSLGQGTTVQIGLPASIYLSGVANKIDVYRYSKVIVLDDDFSIHGIWEKILKDAGKPVEHFYTPAAFLKKYPRLDESILLLSDFEFLNEKMDGVDVINHFDHSLHSILITARSEESDLRKRCKKAGIPFISKSLISYVPINISPPSIVLIDDDRLSHWRWERYKETTPFEFQGFYSIDSFIDDCQNIRKETCILLDSDLGDGVKGEVDGEKISHLGFTNIYLYTSYPNGTVEKPFWIKEIISKDPAIALKRI